MSIFNGQWIKNVIDNFDPYGIKAIIDVELNKRDIENRAADAAKLDKIGKDRKALRKKKQVGDFK